MLILSREYRLAPGLRGQGDKYLEGLTSKVIAARTKKIYIRDGVMHHLPHLPGCRNELMMLRESLRSQINSKAGEEVVREIVIHRSVSPVMIAS
ncbi:MAG: DUF721 domain-containing protein [Marinilabiliales bacterium]|nr:DUF721 domain-containing protein [Marinilabiliales bacterium]